MRKLGALIFPGFELLDLFGPLEMFGMLKDEFSLELVAEKTGAVESNQRVAAYSDTTIHDKPDFDILLIPGGAGTRTEVNNKPLLEWISKTSEKAEYTLSVCTGNGFVKQDG